MSYQLLINKFGVATFYCESDDGSDGSVYTDFVKMLKDMYEFSQRSPNSVIIPSDDPTMMRIGFVVYYPVDRMEVSQFFYIELRDARRTSSSKLIECQNSIQGRISLCNKNNLRGILEGEKHDNSSEFSIKFNFISGP